MDQAARARMATVLKLERKRLGLSLYRVSASLNCSHESIRQVERGAALNPERIKRMAALYAIESNGHVP